MMTTYQALSAISGSERREIESGRAAVTGTDIELINRYLKLRQRRELLLGEDLFADPAWDVLLDLFVAEHAGRKVSVSSACLAAGVPLSTALRWLSKLENKGLIVRRPDELDARRTHVQLTDDAVERIQSLLQTLWPSKDRA
jgi:DNA-binding MarR family transcriptional regulator